MEDKDLFILGMIPIVFGIILLVVHFIKYILFNIVENEIIHDATYEPYKRTMTVRFSNGLVRKYKGKGNFLQVK